MLRYLALAAVLAVSLTASAQAQIGYGYSPYGYNPYVVQQPTYYSPYGVSVYRAPYVVTPYGYNSGYRPSNQYNKPGYFAPAPNPVPRPVYVPSTGGAFGGSPNNGNYYYWLQQQAAQGRMSQNEVNKIMYPGR